MTLGVSGEDSPDTNRMYVGTLGDDNSASGQSYYVQGHGAEGDDTIAVFGTYSWVSVDARHDTLINGLGNDTLKVDYTTGYSGNNILNGNAGDVCLEGNAGDDTLNGGAGADNVGGGLGSDTFIFEPSFENDMISDFTHGLEELKLYDANGYLLSSTNISEIQNIYRDAVLTASDCSSVTLTGVSTYYLPFNITSKMSGDSVTVSFYLDPIKSLEMQAWVPLMRQLGLSQAV